MSLCLILHATINNDLHESEPILYLNESIHSNVKSNARYMPKIKKIKKEKKKNEYHKLNIDHNI